MGELTLRRRLSDWLVRRRRRSDLAFEAMENPDASAVEAVRRGLAAWNDAQIGPTSHVPVGVFVRDPVGRVRGGATGYVGWGWLYVERLWVDDEFRGRHVGTELMMRLERLALDRGVHRFQVGTTSFQALGFYEKMGYEVFAELPDHPPGHTDYFLKKYVALSGEAEDEEPPPGPRGQI